MLEGAGMSELAGKTPVVSLGCVRSAMQPVQLLMGLVEAWVQLLATVGVELVAVHLLLRKPTGALTRGWLVLCVVSLGPGCVQL